MTARAGLRPVAALTALLLGLLAAPAAAHPLGLPAFAQVAADGELVTVTWNAAPDDVAVLARAIGQGGAGDGPLTQEQDAAFARSPELEEQVLRDVVVEQDGSACEAQPSAVDSVVSSGLRVQFRCPEAATQVRVRIALLHGVDARYRTLAAWTAPTGSERAMFSATEPEHDLVLDPAAGPALPAPSQQSSAEGVQGTFGGALPLERRFVTAVDGSPGVAAALLALLVAFGVGALHALAPGHGKAVAAGYLVGERARFRHAAVLGVTVALMHTGSVLALGLALFSATRAPDAARLSSSIGLVTGLTFAGLGIWLLARRWRARGQAAHEHGHDHAPGIGQPLSLQGLVVLGAAGGLLPSPSALLVLLTALAVGEVAYGLTLVGAFSLGLATTVTLVGVAVLRGRDVLHDRAGARLHRLVHAMPLLGAAAVTAVGTAVAVRAAVGLAG